MLQSRNVTLRRASDAPLRRLRDAYGGEEAAEARLEAFVLAAERRVKGRVAALAATAEARGEWQALMVLLADLSDYGALGTMGGADSRLCQRLQPLLTRLMKATLSGGFEVEEDTREKESNDVGVECEDDDDGDGCSLDTEALLQAASRALTNCSSGVARQCADTTLVIDLGSRDDHSTGHASPSSSPPLPLEVSFGFADYMSGETGAMLWAGAVGLSLYLAENVTALIAQQARSRQSSVGQPLRIIELGCGPALVSLVTAAIVAREGCPVPCQLDVTDVSPTVVEAARRSFHSRNGSALAAMLLPTQSSEHTEEGKEAAMAAPPLRVHPFVLDFSAIPPNLNETYDVVVASDVVYDHAIAAHVAPALETLLAPGGVALLCCEAHRDGMAYFTQRIRAEEAKGTSRLRVTAEVRDVQMVLTRLEMLTPLTVSSCSLMRIEKLPC